MQPIRSTFRTALGVASTVGVVAIVHEFGVKYVEQKGWYDNLPERVEVAMTWLASLTEPMWFKFLVTFVVGLSAGTWIDALFRRSGTLPDFSVPAARSDGERAPRALLRLRFSGQLESPEIVTEENIASWFAYWSPGARAADAESGRVLFEVPSSWAIFVTFRQSVDYRQIVTGFIGGRPAMVQIRQNLKHGAVVTIDGGMPACEMEIMTRD